MSSQNLMIILSSVLMMSGAALADINDILDNKEPLLSPSNVLRLKNYRNSVTNPEYTTSFSEAQAELIGIEIDRKAWETVLRYAPSQVSEETIQKVLRMYTNNPPRNIESVDTSAYDSVDTTAYAVNMAKNLAARGEQVYGAENSDLRIYAGDLNRKNRMYRELKSALGNLLDVDVSYGLVLAFMEDLNVRNQNSSFPNISVKSPLGALLRDATHRDQMLQNDEFRNIADYTLKELNGISRKISKILNENSADFPMLITANPNLKFFNFVKIDAELNRVSTSEKMKLKKLLIEETAEKMNLSSRDMSGTSASKEFWVRQLNEASSGVELNKTILALSFLSEIRIVHKAATEEIVKFVVTSIFNDVKVGRLSTRKSMGSDFLLGYYINLDFSEKGLSRFLSTTNGFGSYMCKRFYNK